VGGESAMRGKPIIERKAIMGKRCCAHTKGGEHPLEDTRAGNHRTQASRPPERVLHRGGGKRRNRVCREVKSSFQVVKEGRSQHIVDDQRIAGFKKYVYNAKSIAVTTGKKEKLSQNQVSVVTTIGLQKVAVVKKRKGNDSRGQSQQQQREGGQGICWTECN